MASLISSDLVVLVRFDLFFLLFQVLVCILINVTNFLRNEHFVYIFDGEKLCTYLEKRKFVCKLMHSGHDDVENVATKGTFKQMSFTCIKVTKGFVIAAFMERKDTIINNHLQLHLGKGIL